MISDQSRAERSAQALLENDAATKSLGMKIVEISPGKSVLEMTIRADMLNGHGTCHGGFLFTLADSAFAFACNSYNQSTVAQHCSISFLAPAKLGDTLRAEANERSRMGRSGIYDITVSDQDGKTVAEFRGNSRTINGTHFDET